MGEHEAEEKIFSVSGCLPVTVSLLLTQAVLGAGMVAENKSVVCKGLEDVVRAR